MTTRTPSAHAATGPMGRAALLLTLVAGMLLAGLAGAGPASAVDDPTRPDARVTHGPSCRPGGVVVEVVAGSLPYAVTLATTRTPAGEDAAVIQPGQSAVLATGGVAWGETIDGYLEYTALDGSGRTHVDDLEGYTFTRPAEEDCAAIVAPAAPATVPVAPPGLEGGTSGQPGAGERSEPGTLPAGVEVTEAGTGVPPPAGAGHSGPDRSFGEARPGPAGHGDTVAVAPAAFGHDASAVPLVAAVLALSAAAGSLLVVGGRGMFRTGRPRRNG